MRGMGGSAFRRGVAGAFAVLPLLLTLTLTLAGCGSSGPAGAAGAASPSGSARPSAASAGAYLGCLLQHRGDGPGSARQACTSLRPGDLATVLLTFENCLRAHGVTVPSLPDQGRRAALVQFVSGLRTGGAAERSALRSCTPSGFPG